MFQKPLLEVWLTFNQIVQHLKVAFVMVDLGIESDLPCCAVVRVIEQRCSIALQILSMVKQPILFKTTKSN